MVMEMRMKNTRRMTLVSMMKKIQTSKSPCKVLNKSQRVHHHTSHHRICKASQSKKMKRRMSTLRSANSLRTMTRMSASIRLRSRRSQETKRRSSRMSRMRMMTMTISRMMMRRRTRLKRQSLTLSTRMTW